MEHLPSGLSFMLRATSRPPLHGTFFKHANSSVVWAHTRDMEEPKHFLFVAKQYFGEEPLCTIYNNVFVGRRRAPLSTVLNWPAERIQSLAFEDAFPESCVMLVDTVSNATTATNATATNATVAIDAKEIVRRIRAKNEELTAQLVLLREGMALKEDNRRKETELQSILKALYE